MIGNVALRRMVLVISTAQSGMCCMLLIVCRRYLKRNGWKSRGWVGGVSDQPLSDCLLENEMSFNTEITTISKMVENLAVQETS